MHPTKPNLNRGDMLSWRMRTPFLLLLFYLIVIVHSSTAQQVARTSPGGTNMWVYTPPGYNTGTTNHPLLIFLHGSNELGNDLSKLTTLTTNQYPPKLISTNSWKTSLPFIVVSPQLKRNTYLNPDEHVWPVTYINEVVEFVRKNYRVDGYRIYITGVGLGAQGTWDYAASYPAKVAAIAPISGKAEKTKGCELKSLPIWAFHGSSDALVPKTFPVEMINVINNCSPVFKAKLSLLHARSHEGWNEVYTGALGIDIYTWFLKFRKYNTTNKTPYVNAGPDHTVLLPNSSYTIAGDYFDWDGTISAIRWTQISGTALSVSGTTSAFLKLTGLREGAYEFQLAVTDNTGAVSYDRVKLNVVSTLSNPAVTALTLINGKTNADIKPISDGMVINKSTLGISEFNVRATVSPGTASVRFHVNTDQTTRIVNSPGPYLIKNQTSLPEWVMENGTYTICATPYTQAGGKGTAGTTLCYRVSVTTSATTEAFAERSVEVYKPVAIKVLDDILISNMPQGNQWVFNGEDIKGATGPVYRPTLAGEYYVRVIDRPRFDISNSVLMQKENERRQIKNALEVFPNPGHAYLEISGQSLSENAAYSIMRGTGGTLQQGMVQSNNRIPLSTNLPPGEYILAIKTAKGNQSVKFLIN